MSRHRGPAKQKGVQVIPGLQQEDTALPGECPPARLRHQPRITTGSGTARMEGKKRPWGSQFRTEVWPRKMTGERSPLSRKKHLNQVGDLEKRSQREEGLALDKD